MATFLVPSWPAASSWLAILQPATLDSATPMSDKEHMTGVPMAKPAKPEPGSVQIVGVALVAVWARAMLNQERQVWFSQALTGS